MRIMNKENCHSREGGSLWLHYHDSVRWIPAYAGMTIATMIKYILVVSSVTLFFSTPSIAAPRLGKAPIAIDADALEVLQSQNKAIFTGNVVATQQDMVLKSDKMIIYYQDQQKKGEEESSLGALDRIEVLGRVRMVTSQESADADRGLYDATRDKIFLYGNVILRKDSNILNGSALQYDLTSGASLLTGGAQAAQSSTQDTPSKKPARVRGIFVPKEQKGE